MFNLKKRWPSFFLSTRNPFSSALKFAFTAVLVPLAIVFTPADAEAAKKRGKQSRMQALWNDYLKEKEVLEAELKKNLEQLYNGEKTKAEAEKAEEKRAAAEQKEKEQKAHEISSETGKQPKSKTQRVSIKSAWEELQKRKAETTSGEQSPKDKNPGSIKQLPNQQALFSSAQAYFDWRIAALQLMQNAEANAGQNFPGGYISSHYGDKRKDHTHIGTDIPAKPGSPVHAPLGGVIGKGRYINGIGQTIQVFVNDDFYYEILHCAGYKDRVGQTVKPGDVLGTVNKKDGVSSGPHIHIQGFQKKTVIVTQVKKRTKKGRTITTENEKPTTVWQSLDMSKLNALALNIKTLHTGEPLTNEDISEHYDSKRTLETKNGIIALLKRGYNKIVGMAKNEDPKDKIAVNEEPPTAPKNGKTAPKRPKKKWAQKAGYNHG